MQRYEIYLKDSISKIPLSVKKKYNLNWNKLERTRDIISHAYIRVNINIIWDLIKIELPKLKEAINDISKKE